MGEASGEALAEAVYALSNDVRTCRVPCYRGRRDDGGASAAGSTPKERRATRSASIKFERSRISKCTSAVSSKRTLGMHISSRAMQATAMVTAMVTHVHAHVAVSRPSPPRHGLCHVRRGPSARCMHS